MTTMYQVSQVVMPVKFILMLLQFILIVFVLATREEYVFQGVLSWKAYPGSDEYKQADDSVLAASLIFLMMIFLEFLTLIFGVSIMFNKVNVFQCVLHFIGCLATIWQILNHNNYKMMWSLMAFFGVIPFAMEVSVIVLAFTRYHVIDQVEQIQKNIETEAKARYQEKADKLPGLKLNLPPPAPKKSEEAKQAAPVK